MTDKRLQNVKDAMLNIVQAWRGLRNEPSRKAYWEAQRKWWTAAYYRAHEEWQPSTPTRERQERAMKRRDFLLGSASALACLGLGARIPTQSVTLPPLHFTGMDMAASDDTAVISMYVRQLEGGWREITSPIFRIGDARTLTPLVRWYGDGAISIEMDAR